MPGPTVLGKPTAIAPDANPEFLLPFMDHGKADEWLEAHYLAATDLPPAPAQAEALVLQLGSKETARRDEAEKKLVEMATKIDLNEMLVENIANPDPEIRNLIARILEAPEWGDADKGLQVAVRLEKRQWKSTGKAVVIPAKPGSGQPRLEWKPDETPPLTADIRNAGVLGFTVEDFSWQIQVDGEWYEREPPVAEQKTHDLAAGGEALHFHFTLSNDWKSGNGWGNPLALTPGRHILRVAAVCHAADPQTPVARPVSRAVVLEILAADGKPAAAIRPIRTPAK